MLVLQFVSYACIEAMAKAISCFLSPSSAQTDAGRRWLLIINYTVGFPIWPPDCSIEYGISILKVQDYAACLARVKVLQPLK